MRCDGEGVLRETVRCDYASLILGFFGSLHYLTNVCFWDFVLLFIFKSNVPWHLVFEFCWSFGVFLVVNWVVGKEKVCYWLSNDIVGLVGNLVV